MSIESKAERLVREGKVKLPYPVYFIVEGDESEYEVVLKARNRSGCTCRWSSLYPETKCSHIRACELFLESVNNG